MTSADSRGTTIHSNVSDKEKCLMDVILLPTRRTDDVLIHHHEGVDHKLISRCSHNTVEIGSTVCYRGRLHF